MAEQQFRLLYDFQAQDSRELSCKSGELVFSSTKPDNGWIKVSKSIQGQNGVNQKVIGLVPFNYLLAVPAHTAQPHRPAPPPPSKAPVASAANSRPIPPSPPNGIPVSGVVLASLAIDNAECPICYDDMASKPTAVLLSSQGNNKRSCRHFLHHDCANMLLKANRLNCPICRATYSSVFPVPDFNTDPKGWFACVDFDQSNSLSKTEVLEVLKALLPLNVDALEKSIDNLWKQWDKDQSGEIDFEELCNPKTGLFVYVRNNFARIQKKPPPNLDMGNRESWFCYWDEDGSGSLEKEEIVRGLIKTFNLSSSFSKINELREILDNVWSIFDTDGSGSIELNEFLQRDGLGETLVASLPAFH